MRPRFVLTLFALAVLCAAGALWAGGLRTETSQAVLEGARVLPDLRDRLDRIVRVEVQQADGGYALEERGDGWVAASEHGYPVETERVNRLLVSLANLEKIEPKTADPERFKRLAVGNPEQDPQARLVRLETAEGDAVAELIVGRQRHIRTGRADSGTYVRRPDGDQAWLAAGLADLSDDIYPWLRTDVINVAPGDIRRIEVSRVDGGRLLAVRPERGAPAMAIGSVPEGAQLDVGKVRKLGSLLSDIKFDRVDPAETFQPDRRVAQTVVRTFDGLTLTIDVLRRDERYWLTFEVAASGDANPEAADRAKALSHRIEGWTYQVANYVAERLIRTRDDLLVDAGG